MSITTPSTAFNPLRIRLDIIHLQAAVSFYYQRGLANSTIKLNHVYQQRYIQFCIQHNNLTTFPTIELILLSFVEYLAKHNITHSTIKVYVYVNTMGPCEYSSGKCHCANTLASLCGCQRYICLLCRGYSTDSKTVCVQIMRC